MFQFSSWVGIRILCVRVSGVLRRMGKWQALVCYACGSIRQSSRGQFVPVLLFLGCAG